MKDAVLSCIRTRRSVREFESRDVPRELVNEVLDAARWTQSGKNNQPWRVVVVTSPRVKDALAELSGYPEVVRGAVVLLAVFLDADTPVTTAPKTCRRAVPSARPPCSRPTPWVWGDCGTGAYSSRRRRSQRRSTRHPLGN